MGSFLLRSYTTTSFTFDLEVGQSLGDFVCSDDLQLGDFIALNDEQGGDFIALDSLNLGDMVVE
jgi:hypothetical protein